MNQLIRTMCAIAGGDIGGECADRIRAKAQERYEALCAENVSDSCALRVHTFRRIYPSIAVYEALRAEGIEQEQAVWYIREYFQHFSAKKVPHLQWAIKITSRVRKTPGLSMQDLHSRLGMHAGFVYEFPERYGNEARFNIVRCPYYETCKRYGCPEITQAFCDGDEAGYRNMQPRLILGCTKMIGRGGDCCDFLLKY